MDIRNRLPPEYFASLQAGRRDPAKLVAAAGDTIAEAHTRDAVAALLHLLTRLANCGLDAGAPPLLRSAGS